MEEAIKDLWVRVPNEETMMFEASSMLEPLEYKKMTWFEHILRLLSNREMAEFDEGQKEKRNDE